MNDERRKLTYRSKSPYFFKQREKQLRSKTKIHFNNISKFISQCYNTYGFGWYPGKPADINSTFGGIFCLSILGESLTQYQSKVVIHLTKSKNRPRGLMVKQNSTELYRAVLTLVALELLDEQAKTQAKQVLDKLWSPFDFGFKSKTSAVEADLRSTFECVVVASLLMPMQDVEKIYNIFPYLSESQLPGVAFVKLLIAE